MAIVVKVLTVGRLLCIRALMMVKRLAQVHGERGGEGLLESLPSGNHSRLSSDQYAESSLCGSESGLAYLSLTPLLGDQPEGKEQLPMLAGLLYGLEASLHEQTFDSTTTGAYTTFTDSTANSTKNYTVVV